jgi:hypothetical protein
MAVYRDIERYRRRFGITGNEGIAGPYVGEVQHCLTMLLRIKYWISSQQAM